MRVVDLLVDDDARATWARLTDQEQTALVRWVNKPSTNRGRLERQQEAKRTLQLGTPLPWGTP